MGYYIENVLISGKRKRRSLFELKKKESKKMSQSRTKARAVNV